MSDKHTDAQGNFKKFDLTKDVPVTYSNSTGRATEGQAQTSAADSEMVRALCDGIPLQEPVNIGKALRAKREARVSLSGGTGPVACVMLVNIQLTSWAEGPEKAEAYAKGFNDALKFYRQALLDLPAQLADSAAPGAPVEEAERIAEKLAAVWADIKRLVEQHTGKPCGPEPMDDLAAILAAPTEQQSLTAGGAVLEHDYQIEELFKAHGGRWADNSYWQIEDADLHPFVRAVINLAGKAVSPEDQFADDHEEMNATGAAAPLPQVQSEALDVLRDLARYWDKSHISADEANDEMCSIEWRVHTIIAATDQQPVTSSGALADNDGGVA